MWSAAIPMQIASTDRDSPPKFKKEFQSLLGKINYLGKYSPATSEICQPLRRLTSVKSDWPETDHTRNYMMSQKLKKDTCMKSYNEKKNVILRNRCIRGKP